MSEHYFSENPHSKSSPKTWNCLLREKTYHFTSDAGVFSKNTVDFGTRLLIEQFDYPQVSGDLLDLGCGYGPIGMTLADGAPERQVLMADINERAVELAKKNAEKNGVHNVEVVQSDGFADLGGRQFAAVLINPPIRAGKKLIYRMFEDAEKALLSGGALWIVIQKKQGAPSAEEKLEALFGNVETVAKSKGYYILRAVKV